ncbi:MAG: SDR family oxidoreductase [Burkholderiales bacterium]|nr:SDR family oxidoreductase [Burkholderiales bacterium]
MNNEKIAIITGSSSGIGKATAILLSQEGYKICVNYNNNKNGAEDVVDVIKRSGRQAIAVKADISNEDEVVEMFNIVDAELGALTALVNNAGILLTQSSIEGLNEARINAILHTNVTGTIICCREAIKRMSHKNGGHGGGIVNVSSAASRLGSPGEYIDYAASKGAIDTLTIGLAQEVAAYGVRVNCVRPGFIHTGMHAAGGEPNRIERIKSKIPMLRGGEDFEVANAIYWLLSENSSFSTGIFIDVSGGK